MPFIGLALTVIFDKFYRWYDIGFSKDLRKTQCSNIMQFNEYYSKNEFEIAYKYSDCLNVAFLAMFYGFGMPIMFPMAAIILYF